MKSLDAFPATPARWLLSLALAAGALATAADSMAQLGGGFPGGGGRGSRGGSKGQQQDQREQPRQPVMQEQNAVLLEQAIEELRVDLKLQPTQVPAWETYIGKARLLAGDMARERMLSMSASTQMDALKLINRSVDATRNRLAALEEIADAARAFYALLTPEQQAVANPRLAAVIPGAGGGMPARASSLSAPPRTGPPQ